MLTTLRSPFRVFLCLLVLISALAALYLSTHIQARAEGIPASTTQANWPQWQYDAAHTNFNPHESLLSSFTVSQLTRAWEFTGKVSGVSSPIVANGVIYAGLQSGTVDAIYAGNGNIKWTSPISTSTIPFLSLANGVLYTSAKNNFLAIDAATGALLFQQSLGSLVRGTSITSPAIANGMVYITTINDWTLYAFHLPS